MIWVILTIVALNFVGILGCQEMLIRIERLLNKKGGEGRWLNG